jgi:hypothetical protein
MDSSNATQSENVTMTLERRGHDDIPSQCQTASGGVVTVTGGPAVPVAAAVSVTVVIRASASLGGPPSDRPEADCQWPGPGAAAGRGRLGSMVMVAERASMMTSSLRVSLTKA